MRRLRPLSPCFRGKLRAPRPPLGSPPPGPGCFWIESPEPTGSRVSMVRVSESGSQKLLSYSSLLTTVEYKIEHISRTDKMLNYFLFCSRIINLKRQVLFFSSVRRLSYIIRFLLSKIVYCRKLLVID